jgi:hypothetical protein
MEAKRKTKPTERPKIRRVYVSLVNAENPNDREYFTLYNTTIAAIKRKLVAEPSDQPTQQPATLSA